MSNSLTPNLHFAIQNPVPVVTSSKLPVASSARNSFNDLGATGAEINPALLASSTIVVRPTAIQTYTLPSASDIISIFGIDVDTGIPRISTGQSIKLNVINKGTAPAYILSGPTGGDGTAIIAFTGAANASNATGSTPHGKVTPLTIEFTSVSSSLLGATGAYTVYC